MNKAVNLVDIEEAKTLLGMVVRNTLAGRYNKFLNVCLHGSPGLGKSAIVAQISKEHAIRLIDLRLSAMQESDVLGIPFTYNGVMKFSTPEWWPDGSAPTILFLDELKSALPAVQTAAYRLILDRSIQNGSVLPNNCIVVAAGNLKEDKTGARDLLPAAANRFGMHLIIDKSRAAEPFLNYAVNNNFSRSVVGYLSWKRESVYGTIGDEAAFATPRTWEDVDNIMQAWDIAGDRGEYLRNIAIAGAVGSVEAMSFAGYLENEARLPDWNRIRAGDETYSFSVPRGDMCFEYAIAVGLAFELLDALKKNDKEGIENLVKLCDDIGKDMVVVMFKTMKRDISTAARMLAIPSIKAQFEAVRKYIK